MSKVALLLLVSGSVCCSPVTKQATGVGVQEGMLLNPNFEQGLAGWSTTGNVTVVPALGVLGIRNAASLVYDGNQSSTLYQDVVIPDSSKIEVALWQAGPGEGSLLVSLVQGSNELGAGGTSGGPSFARGAKVASRVNAGPLRIKVFIDGVDTSGRKINTPQSAKVTGITISPIDGLVPSDVP